VDAKTLLLLGAGMAVLSLVGFCSAQSRSAGMIVGRSAMHGSPSPDGRSLREGETKPLLIKSEIPLAPVGATR
jgi:hypothetical protein